MQNNSLKRRVRQYNLGIYEEKAKYKEELNDFLKTYHRSMQKSYLPADQGGSQLQHKEQDKNNNRSSSKSREGNAAIVSSIEAVCRVF